jgi:hypothetical protein
MRNNMNLASDIIDIDDIFMKIAPYLSNPEEIKILLKNNSQKTRKEFKKLIEIKLKNSDPITKTDLRILLNSL